MRKFCFVCGKGTEELSGGMCGDCLKRKEHIGLPGKMEVTVCGKCEKMLFKNKWVEFSLEKIVESSLRLKHPAKIKSMEARHDRKKIAAVFFLIPHSGGETRESHESALHINKVICPFCSRKHSGYYEAVLQMRGFSEKDMEKLSGVFDMLEKKTFYRIKEVKGGFDIKVGNKLMIKSLAKNIRNRFLSEMKESSKIVTKIDGRDVHRKFVLIRKRLERE